ncbi:FAD/NAD(P)-binding domain-containing protein [Purpureocillium lavendulum]|uniref:FAD/NAD(P)-binding domain-containing protein n=1 Tax=Purpureocillium lavendulum TaxID=1247861 RepID=A0AB34FFK4_9HYPO|nr:FAD/NAD(P)-binding domain-containing protein [Purpureocillium lavendulum]
MKSALAVLLAAAAVVVRLVAATHLAKDYTRPKTQPFLEPTRDVCSVSIAANKKENPVRAHIREDCMGSLAWCYWRWYELEEGTQITSVDDCYRARGLDPRAVVVPRIVNASAYFDFLRTLDVAVKAYSRFSAVRLFMDFVFDGENQPDWIGSVNIQNLEATNEERRLLAKNNLEAAKRSLSAAFEALFVPDVMMRLDRSWYRITYRWSRILRRSLDFGDEIDDLRDWLDQKTLGRWARTQSTGGRDVWIQGSSRGRGSRVGENESFGKLG